MAIFTAQQDKAAGYCRRRVQSADVYVGIIGFRYGSLVGDDERKRSYVELEFDAAAEKGMPQLVFLLDEDAVLPFHRSVYVLKPVTSGNARSKLDSSSQPHTESHTMSSLKERGRVKRPVWVFCPAFPRGCGHAGLARGLPWGLGVPCFPIAAPSW